MLRVGVSKTNDQFNSLPLINLNDSLSSMSPFESQEIPSLSSIASNPAILESSVNWETRVGLTQPRLFDYLIHFS